MADGIPHIGSALDLLQAADRHLAAVERVLGGDTPPDMTPDQHNIWRQMLNAASAAREAIGHATN